jgi:Major Facilitator Superfamily
MSRIFAAYSVGGLIGPTLGAFGGIRGPFLTYLALLLAALPLALLVGEPQARREFAADRAVLRTRGFWVASAAILFAVLALGVLEGVLPLHFAERLSQGQIGGLYVGASLIVAVSAAAAGGMRPRPLVFAAVLLAVAGTSLAGMAADVPLWLLALALAAVGIGIANTGSLGLLVDAVPVQRIVTAMAVWSQIGIAGYLLGPLAGGIVADSLGYAFVGTVSAVAGLLVVALLRTPPLTGDTLAPGRHKRQLSPVALAISRRPLARAEDGFRGARAPVDSRLRWPQRQGSRFPGRAACAVPPMGCVERRRRRSRPRSPRRQRLD